MHTLIMYEGKNTTEALQLHDLKISTHKEIFVAPNHETFTKVILVAWYTRDVNLLH